MSFVCVPSVGVKVEREIPLSSPQLCILKENEKEVSLALIWRA